MKKMVPLFILAAMIFNSCGPSAEQKAAAEKAIMDSVANATKAQEENKVALQKESEDLILQLAQLKEEVKQKMADLEGAKTKMSSVKDFQLLRSADEKEQEVKEQSLVILNLEEEIESLKKQITEGENRLAQVEGELKSFN